MVNTEEYVLLVDDSQTNNVLLEAVLAEVGYETATAMSASEAWSLIHKRRPRLILLDLLMPKISGFQLLERLKEKPLFAQIPVIVVSALSDADTAMRLKEMGADDFFSKPLNLQALLKRVEELYQSEPSL